MHKLYFIIYSFKEALVSIWRNKIINILSIGTITISLFILGMFFLITLNLGRVIEDWSEKVQINIYLDNEISQSNFLYIRDRINSSPEVESFVYISEKEAIEEFKKIFTKYETFADRLGEGVFPASFEIKVKQEYRIPEKIEKFVNRFRGMDGIEEIYYDRDWIVRLSTIVKLVRIFGMFLGIILIFAAVSTTANVIKMNIISRKDEIGLMRLVGASNQFIKGPFFFEGLLQGLIAAGIALGALYFLFDSVRSYLSTSFDLFFSFTNIEYLGTFHIIVFILGGTLVGTLGSLLSLGRFLKI